MRSHRVLVIEDDAVLRTGLRDLLVFHGFDVEVRDNGEDGLQAARALAISLVILDLTLPLRDGMEVCQCLRAERPELPIIMLTARGEERNIIEGFSAGADDYLTKPFSVQELILRIRAIFRRSHRPTEFPAEIIIGQMTISPELRRGVIEDARGRRREVRFSEKEIALLAYLATHPDRPVSRGELLCAVWGYRAKPRLETRTVDIHIAKLRRKIETDPEHPKFLVTYRGAGYLLERHPTPEKKCA